MNSEINKDSAFEEQDFNGEASQLRSEQPLPQNTEQKDSAKMQSSSAIRREDNRDEYFYQAPKEVAKFDGSTRQVPHPPAQEDKAPRSDIQYDYYKSYPSYGPGAPYGDHERGEEFRRKADHTDD